MVLGVVPRRTGLFTRLTKPFGIDGSFFLELQQYLHLLAFAVILFRSYAVFDAAIARFRDDTLGDQRSFVAVWPILNDSTRFVLRNARQTF
jgi:hypothetical protein